ncbi:imidazole glycerol phosphate synthase subunit HisH [Maribacter cobaltidurans]|uniref:Imidazole glycerol phosphate synthase subunit HisH n=1 Tax=Maribacter cobaltidurans TaxID=1178778 RepID=A0A223V594_9FLAO|nr:imidazole glycerol phosphate synthase subunit HisH [Maribacter cobaltidurans]ASV30188.1 imidazole glycerol phosphate synthase subunit HisH [Maribacter cobaltidurans]GGD76489.1 imidazole glycerol phosphate synthase subunit HisH [Maribacter cobaltidurans]
MGETNKKVTIIDYQLGNLFSVKQACDTVGINAEISSKREDILNSAALILPGVGAFIEAMNNLKSLDLIDAIKEKVDGGTALFGICLGQQLLFTNSEEFGAGNGLDLIKGVIKKFPDSFNGEKMKVPHIAWNKVYSENLEWKGTALDEIDDNEFMYFVHSYYVEPLNDECILAKANYSGLQFCSSILVDNIFATQFHPEKSGDKGISIYKKWSLINNLL